MNILFIGCVESSYTQLELLIKHGKHICGIITKSISKFNADFYDLSPLGTIYNIPTLYVENINDKITIEFIESCQPDVIYCFGWSQLIHREILELPKYGVIGNHPAALPNNRGRHPIIWALVLGLNTTASSFFVMNEGTDTGNIISQEEIPILYSDYARDLYDRITKLECSQILKLTDLLEQGKCELKKQNLKEGNFWRKRHPEDGIIDWRMSSRAIYNLIRALSHPYVGAEFIHDERSVKVWKSDEIITDAYRNIEPGKVVKYVSEQDYYVKAYDNIIHIMESDNFYGREGEYLL